MKRIVASTFIIIFAIGALSLVGCESANPTTAPSGEQNAYAGGTGVFGEDSVNPGEHSRQRFVDSALLHSDQP